MGARHLHPRRHHQCAREGGRCAPAARVRSALGAPSADVYLYSPTRKGQDRADGGAEKSRKGMIYVMILYNTRIIRNARVIRNTGIIRGAE